MNAPRKQHWWSMGARIWRAVVVRLAGWRLRREGATEQPGEAPVPEPTLDELLRAYEEARPDLVRYRRRGTLDPWLTKAEYDVLQGHLAQREWEV